MNRLFILLFLPMLALATPPACLISCVAEVAHTCSNGKIDMTCLCIKEDSVVGCLVDICPYGTFLSARDHYLGTCMEHGKPTKSNPNPPPSIISPPPLPPAPSSTSTIIVPTLTTVTTPIQTSLTTSTIQSSPLIITTLSPIVEPSQPPPPPSVSKGTTIPNPIIPTPTPKVTTPSHPTFTLPVESSTKFQPSPIYSSSKPTQTGGNENDCDDKDKVDYDDEGDEDCDNKDQSEDDYDNDYENDDYYDQDDNEVDNCEWEETQTFDENGQIIIIRRPVNVPKKYLDPNNNGIIRRVIIKKSNGKKYIKPVESNYKTKNRNSSLRMIRKLKTPKPGSIPETKLIGNNNSNNKNNNGFRRQNGPNPTFSSEKLYPNTKNQRIQPLPVYPRYRNRHQRYNNY